MAQVAVRANQGVPTQADRRRNMVMKDQHGRSWFAVIEKSSGYPTGLVQPLFAVADPRLVPPQKYLDFPADQPGQIRIDYDSWEAHQRERQKEWDADRIKLINTMPGGAANPAVAMEMGPQPMSWKMVRAMKQGNRWALGFTDKKPPEAEVYFPTPVEAPDDQILSETDQILSEEIPTVDGVGTSLKALLDELKGRCPPNLRGAARNAWMTKELEKLAVDTVEEA